MQLSTKGKSGAGDVNSVFCAMGGDPSSKGSTVSAEHVQDLLAREFEVRARRMRRSPRGPRHSRALCEAWWGGERDAHGPDT